MQDNVSGLLVDPGNTSQLADAMVRLVQSDVLRLQLSEQARAFVRPRFGVDGYIASITALYDRLLTAKQVSAFANATADKA